MAAVQKRWWWIGAIAVVIAAAAAWGLLRPHDNTPYVPLLTYDLNSKQLDQVKSFLEKEGYEYQVKGQQVLVHQGQLSDVLVEMAKAGVPSAK